MIIIPPPITLELARQHQRDLQAAARRRASHRKATRLGRRTRAAVRMAGNDAS